MPPKSFLTLLIRILLITKIGGSWVTREGFKSSISTFPATATTSLNLLLLASTLGSIGRDALFEQIRPTARKMRCNNHDISGVNFLSVQQLCRIATILHNSFSAVVISILFSYRTLPKATALRYDEADKLCEEAKGQTLTSSSVISRR